ncbi:hypothetical protein ACIPSA_34830 [Streptomyces sp. NPDC086549]|uniref:hypothetical protein n=1 Tax=Streptomyces sp. NPDC086549 TaxID=3365752 RepID=UPI00381633E4
MGLTVVSDGGREWRLTERIGGGSEGIVYAVADARPLVAKLVPDPPDPDAYRRRVARLVRQRREPRTVGLLSGTPVRLAWPMVPVRTAGGGADGVDGYVMTDMRHAYQPLAHLLTPAARGALLPGATWATALAAAHALALLLAELHAEGYVVGDLKPDNLWVDHAGRVGMTDVDSWQFTDGREVFPGRMRTPGYTAPERIGAPAGTPPDTASDDFLLAVLVHQLLMAGLHPFAGHPADGSDYLSYDDNVLHGRCRITDRTSVLLPRSAPPADLLPRRLVDLFRAAFEGARPRAEVWARELAAELAPGRLKTCAVNARHVHTVERPWCPWCDQAERGTDSYPQLGDERSADGFARLGDERSADGFARLGDERTTDGFARFRQEADAGGLSRPRQERGADGYPQPGDERRADGFPVPGDERTADGFARLRREPDVGGLPRPREEHA